jgi:hypothetical protein
VKEDIIDPDAEYEDVDGSGDEDAVEKPRTTPRWKPKKNYPCKYLYICCLHISHMETGKTQARKAMTKDWQSMCIVLQQVKLGSVACRKRNRGLGKMVLESKGESHPRDRQEQSQGRIRILPRVGYNLLRAESPHLDKRAWHYTVFSPYLLARLDAKRSDWVHQGIPSNRDTSPSPSSQREASGRLSSLWLSDRHSTDGAVLLQDR